VKEALPLVKLGEILTHNTDYIDAPEPRIYPKLSVKLYGKGVVLDAPADGRTLKMKRHQLARVGQVILSEIWGKKGAIGLVPPEGEGALCTSHFFLFDVQTQKADLRWLRIIFLANYLQEQLEAEAKGSTGYAAVRPKTLLACEFPLPSISEQRRIVARIEELASKIVEIRSLRQQALSDTDILARAAFSQIREDLLRRDFPRKKIGQVAEVTSGGTPSREIATYWGGNIPWVTSGELLDGDIYETEQHITREGLENSSAKLFPPGTVLVGLYGQGQTRGRTGRLMIEASTNQACCAILPVPSVLEPRFTQYWLRGLYDEMRRESRDGAQPNWNGQMIKNIDIAIPPVSEQLRIVDHLDHLQKKVDALMRHQTQTAAEIEVFLPSVLDKAFKGGL
jgi:type I restriction enzyme S subunit